MGKKKRAKAKVRRFGEGSARQAVDESTYGVGNALGANPALMPRAADQPGSGRGKGGRELLVVDGYNAIFASGRYEDLVFDRSDDPLSSDVFLRAREVLINDVAAFALGRYEAVIVFDAARNPDPVHPEERKGGVRVVYSPAGVSADTVIQDLCIEAREAGRACSVVTSDGTIQATVMGKGVTRISSRMFVRESAQVNAEVDRAIAEAPKAKLTVADRLSPEMRAKLDALRGRS